MPPSCTRAKGYAWASRKFHKPSSRFLLAGAAAAAQTANAIKPAVTGPASPASFAFGIIPSEWPVQTGLFQLATGAFAARGGGTKGLRGKLGLAAYAASGAGLVAIHRKAKEAGGVLEAALVDELGELPQRIREPFSPPPEEAVTRASCAADVRAASATELAKPHSATRPGNHSTCGSAPTFPMTPKRRCCFRCTVARG